MAGAKLNTVIPISRVLEAAPEFKTSIKSWPNGRTTARREWASSRRSWEIEYDGITLAQFQLLEAHFAANYGRYGTFAFDDPHTGQSFTVRYDQDELNRKPVKPNTRIYKVRVKLQQVKP